ncbi:MAG: hypothetical protein WCD18_17880, partial [Thermosynechococcaceae cyanobacterium]
MPNKKMFSKSFLPKKFKTSQSGISLAELAVTVIVATVILSVSLGLIVTQRRQYLNQQANTDTSQNLQAAMDMVGNDIRQVGERISSGTELPVVRIIDGAAGSPDTLVLQRKLLDTQLNVCDTLNGPVNVIRVADKKNRNKCSFSDGDTPANGIPDDVDQWKTYRCQLDGVAGCQNPPGNCKQTGGGNSECSWAFIYNPVTGTGNFLLYSDEGVDGDPDYYQIRLAQPVSLFYPVDDEPKIYILEQRTYGLSNPDSKGDRILNLQLIDSLTNVTYS